MPASLRRRLLLIMLGVFSVAWIATALGAYLDSRSEIEDLLDAELEQVAKVLLTLSQHELTEERVARGITSESTLEIYDYPLLRDKFDAKLAFQVWINGNTLALRSSNSPTTRFSSLENGFSVLRLGAEEWRIFSLTDERTHITAVVGEHDSVREALVSGASLRTILPLLLGVPLIGVLTWLGVGRGLRPLGRIAEQVTRRSPYDLTLIDTAHAPQETRPLIEALNRLFTRLGRAFENSRRFTADAAHELRTPLAGMAAQADVALLTEDAARCTTALQQMKIAIKNMTRLVSQLLALARWDTDVMNILYCPVDFSALVSTTLRQFETAAAARDIHLTLTAPAAVTLDADEMGLQLIARNIIDNAIAYTPQGGEVVVAVGEREDWVWLSVSDSGPGIAPEQRELIFQRFYRGDHQHHAGSGLGLSIVQRCVNLHGGEIKLLTSEARGLQVMVRLPKHKMEHATDRSSPLPP